MSTARETQRTAEPQQRIERPRLQAPVVPDPLEGVVEGANRAERYRSFQMDVLARIWPAGTSGEYGDDFHRPARYDKRLQGADTQDWISGYTQFSPDGRDMVNLDPDALEVVVTNLGTPDYVRVRSVPPQLLDPNMRPMHVGGSCIIETWGMRTMNELGVGVRDGQVDPSRLPETARKFVDVSPTVTHASGAMLGGYRNGVHLVESDMWAERIHKEYGVPQEEAQEITAQAYDRINETVRRRSKLINPDSTILAVNFDELGLPKAIETWMSQMGVKYDPSFRIAEVIHTYVGPEQLELVKGAIQRQLDADGHDGRIREAMVSLLDATHHVRGKQIDHLRWGSMDLPKEVIMGMREPTPDETQKMEEDPAYARGIRIMKFIYETHMEGAPTSVAAGFADLPTFRNGVQHETRLNFKGRVGTPEETNAFLASVDSQFTDPSRLHRRNVDSHLAYLNTFTQDTKSAKQALSAEMGRLQGELGTVRKARQNLEKAQSLHAQNETAAMANEEAISLCVQMEKGELRQVTETDRRNAAKMRETAQRSLQGVTKRLADNLGNEYDKVDAQRLPLVIEALSLVDSGQVPAPDEQVSLYMAEARQRLEKANAESRKTRGNQVETARMELEKAVSSVPDCDAKEARAEELKAQLAELVSPSYFPLSENPFVHHSMQFLWDPDFAVFMRESVRIQEGRANGSVKKEDSNEQMRALMERLYPKLEAYINYLYGRTDYPTVMRYTQVLSN